MENAFVGQSGGAAVSGSRTSASKRVLVVDDDDCIRELLAEFLDQMNFDVACASDGREALEIFQRDRADLVITDFQMPVMNGLGLMIGIKALSPRTPVVVITGEVGITPDKHPELASALAIIHKPFKLKRIKSILDIALATDVFEADLP